MNHNRLEELWDEARDGTLTPAQRLELDALLANDPQARSLWDAESGWLSMLNEDKAGVPRAGDAFIEGVLSQWSKEASPVVGRIGFQRFRVWAMSIAAALLLAAGAIIAMQVFSNDPTPVDPNKGTVAVNPPETDAIAMLMTSTRDTYAAAAAAPAKLKETVTNPGALLDVNLLVNFFDPGVPDPADFVTPGGRS